MILFLALPPEKPVWLLMYRRVKRTSSFFFKTWKHVWIWWRRGKREYNWDWLWRLQRSGWDNPRQQTYRTEAGKLNRVNVQKYLNTNTSYSWMDRYSGIGTANAKSGMKNPNRGIYCNWLCYTVCFPFAVAFPRTVSTRTPKWSRAILRLLLPTEK